jgi:hypothetical protein
MASSVKTVPKSPAAFHSHPGIPNEPNPIFGQFASVPAALARDPWLPGFGPGPVFADSHHLLTAIQLVVQLKQSFE